MPIRFRPVLVISALIPTISSAIPADPTVYYFVTTSHTQAQVQLDINHTCTWVFNPIKDFYFGGGKFILKDGSATGQLPPDPDGIVRDGTLMKIWEGNREADPLFQFYLTNAQFVAAKTALKVNDQSFGKDPVPYLASGTITLLQGRQYTITLSSPVPDRANMQYFIKDPNDVGFYSGSGTPLNDPANPNASMTISYNQSGPTPPPAVPEPGPAALVAGGLALAVLGVRRRWLH